MEFQQGKSQKFWMINRVGKKFSVEVGRLCTTGQIKSKQCALQATAKAVEETLIAEKLD